MRIVAGSAGRLPLDVPKGLDVRPTMDKVRAAVFDSIGGGIQGARVADLFAGSGALGIEALSRGASHATFVEHDRRSLACIAGNLNRTKLAGLARIEPLAVERFLALHAGRPSDQFDFVFADPPYATRPGVPDHLPALLGDRGVRMLLAPSGLLVLEAPARHPLPPNHAWETVRDQAYGRTRVLFLRLTSDQPPIFQAPGC